jgi:hypothetical protein
MQVDEKGTKKNPRSKNNILSSHIRETKMKEILFPLLNYYKYHGENKNN